MLAFVFDATNLSPSLAMPILWRTALSIAIGTSISIAMAAQSLAQFSTTFPPSAGIKSDGAPWFADFPTPTRSPTPTAMPVMRANPIVPMSTSQPLGQWVNVGPPGASVSQLAIDPRFPSVLYAGTNATGISKSKDGGSTWQAANNGLITPMNYPVPDPFLRSTVYAASFRGEHSIYKTTNGGASWQPASSGIPAFGVSLGYLTAAPSTSGTLFATFRQEGPEPVGLIFRSTDGGASWVQITRGLEGRLLGAIAVDPFSASTVYVGTNFGLYKTTNAGDSWAPTGVWLPYPWIAAVATDPNFANTLYVSSVNSEFTGGGISKSTDGGATWTLTAFPLGQAVFAVFAIVITRSNPGRIYVGGGSGISWSEDGGASWTRLPSLPDPVSFYSIYGIWIAPGSPASLYAHPASGGSLWKMAIDGIPFRCERCPQSVPLR